jgi:hypothetical protein
MGLDISHDAFSGAYSTFGRFRREIARVVGVKFPPHNDPELDNVFIYFPEGFEDRAPGLFEFFCHSDCDGEIGPDTAAKLADEL